MFSCILRRTTTQEFSFPPMLTMSEAPAPPPPEIVLRVDMHCEDCAGKARRCLKDFPGVEDVETDCKTQKMVVKGEKADPVAVLERIQKKINRHVELLSPIPKPPAEDPKKPEFLLVGPVYDSVPGPSFSRYTNTLAASENTAFFKPCSYNPPFSSWTGNNMNFGDFICSIRNVILSPKPNVGQTNPEGEEKIAEERAYCIVCYNKLAEGDELLKSVCGCTNAPVHVTCADTGTRKEGNICNYCGQEVHNEAVTLHRVITTTQEVNMVNNKKLTFCSCSMM